MPNVTVTRRLQFNAAHRVHNPALSDEENERLFGKCNNPNWHGHNYTLDVSVCGPVDERTGYVLDLGALVMQGPGWIHLLLTIGVSLLIFRIVVSTSGESKKPPTR